MSRTRFLGAFCAAAVVAAGVASAALPSSAAHTAVRAAVPSVSVYDAIPNPLPPNVASLGFQSNHTAEFGDYVHLAGTGRKLASVTVTMSDHALYSDYSSDPRYSGNSVSWTHPITINVYTNHLVNGVPDQKIATVTQTTTIPWLPPGYGFSGIAFNATFDMSSLNVTLPNDVIVSVAFNTETFGSAPIGVPGPYISLNVGAPTGNVATIGTDDNADAVFLNANNSGGYDNGCAGGVVGQFCEDTGWAPNGTLPFRIQTEGATITVTKKLVPSYDPGRFNLLVDGTTYAHNVGDNGTTGQVTVAPGTHVVSETAGTNANLGNYVPRITCSDGSAGYGTSLSVSTTAGENLACTITNTRKLYRA